MKTILIKELKTNDIVANFGVVKMISEYYNLWYVTFDSILNPRLLVSKYGNVVIIDKP